MSHLYHNRPFNVRYAVWQDNGRFEGLRAHRTAKASALYITRKHGIDDVGPTPDWSTRDDLVATGRVGPARANNTRLAGMGLWIEADRHARIIRPDEPTCAHAVGSLPQGMSVSEWKVLVTGFCEDHMATQGMTADWAIHQRAARDGAPEILPHVHLLITTRVYDPNSWATGTVRQNWLRTANARKAMGDRWMAATGIYPSELARAA